MLTFLVEIGTLFEKIFCCHKENCNTAEKLYYCRETVLPKGIATGKLYRCRKTLLLQGIATGKLYCCRKTLFLQGIGVYLTLFSLSDVVRQLGEVFLWEYI